MFSRILLMTLLLLPGLASAQSTWMALDVGYGDYSMSDLNDAINEINNIAGGNYLEEIDGGIRTIQPVGDLSGIARQMDIVLAADKNEVRVTHRLQNCGDAAVDLAPWSLSVMATDGMAVIPMPAKRSRLNIHWRLRKSWWRKSREIRDITRLNSS